MDRVNGGEMDIEQPAAILKKNNPLRSDMPWLVVVIQGLVIGGIGLYAILAEDSALKNIVMLIGIFLMLSGFSAIYAAIRDRREISEATPFNYFRAGIALSVGAIIVGNRIWEFMEINAARTIVGIGLVAIGVIAILGLIVISRKTEFRLAAYGLPLILTVLGIVVIYQSANDNNSSKLLGWVALAIGLGLLALGYVRRQQQAEPALGVA
jgi:uncharacterized membrane protein HdeD (DUF308 family)